MKKTLSEEYSFLNTFKLLIMLSVVIYTIFFLISIVKLLEYISHSGNSLILITSVLTYILFLVSSVGVIMIINFLFKLDETKNNLEGKKTNYYRSGKKQLEGSYKEGKKDGLFTWWYDNGQMKQEGKYKDGEPDGLFTLWYENGQKEIERPYKDGYIVGPGKKWNEDGSVKE